MLKALGFSQSCVRVALTPRLGLVELPASIMLVGVGSWGAGWGVREWVGGLVQEWVGWCKNNLGDCWSFVGLFIGNMWLNNGFKSSGESF